MPDLPSGTVTFLFTDIEGSTALWERDRTAMATAVERHIAQLDTAIQAHGGIHFKTIGDAVQAAFPTAPQAVAAAVDGQRALLAEDWGEIGPLTVRMALHAGEAIPDARGDYLAAPLNRLSRLLSAGYGEQILLSQVVQQLTRGALPPGADLRHLGEHRLRDLLEPEHVFQLLHPDLPDRFPPLKSLGSRPNNLPRQPTAFVGREAEVRQVVDLLRREEVELLTLTGPGGTGKTRLALQAAAELLEDFADGVFFVPLAPLTASDLVPSAIASALGLRDEGERPLVARLQSFLADKQLLLLLDNVEHLTDATPLVAEVLVAAPNLKVLATSRAPLRLRAEREYPVPPLGLPPRTPLLSSEQLSEYEAVRLFVARAQAVQPNFAVDTANTPAVAEICHRLDGLPLAIELAAARVRMLPPPALLARLDKRLPLLTGGARDAPERQRTLRATIAWSHDLLAPEERVLFRRLAVFAGGCTLEVAEAVGNQDGALDAFGGLERLCEHSLVRQDVGPGDEPRFVMLETIREFGLERLAESGEEAAIRKGHAALFMELAEAAAPALTGPDPGPWLDQLETEHDNLRGALWWAVSTDGKVAMRLGAALWRFWDTRGHLGEARGWLEQVLAGGDELASAERAAALTGLANIVQVQGDHQRAREVHEEALGLWRSVGDPRGEAITLDCLGYLAQGRGEYGEATDLHGQALELATQAGDERIAGHALLNLGTVALHQGRYEHAAAHYVEALARLRRVGDERVVSSVLGNLGALAFLQEEYGQATDHYREALSSHKKVGDRQGMALMLANLGEVLQYQGEFERAESHFAEALPVLREIGDKPYTAFALLGLGRLALDQQDIDRAARLLTDSLELYRQEEDIAGIAECLEALAGLAAGGGEAERAARLFGAADALREQAGAPLAPAYRSRRDRSLAAAQTALGPDRFSAALAAGRSAPTETVSFAMDLGNERPVPGALPPDRTAGGP
jgi:predicted ATPase/class 3 adenylate cyclase/Tfp pilus assembly protein PilF